MKILVCVKQVPDTSGRLAVNPDGTLNRALMQTIITPICRLLPVIIFCTLYQMIAESQFSGLLQLLKYPLLLALCCAVWLLFSLLRICLHRHLRPLPLLKKLLSATVIAFSTASSTAAFSTNVENCENRLGIDRGLIDVAVPLGQATFMPGTVMLFLCFGFCMAERYRIPIGFSWILTLCIVSILIAIAAPPVPGSAFSCLVLIAAQLGIDRSTVKNHLSILFSKLGVSTRAEAVALALRKQLLKA